MSRVTFEVVNLQVHLDYLEAGANIIISSSYQVNAAEISAFKDEI